MSQADVARLLGGTAGTSVLRHESNQRTPYLDTALAYAVVFGIDPRELFAGRYEDACRLVQKNAKRLLQELGNKSAPVPPPKLNLLHRLAETDDVYFVPCDDERCGE